MSTEFVWIITRIGKYYRAAGIRFELIRKLKCFRISGYGTRNLLLYEYPHSHQRCKSKMTIETFAKNRIVQGLSRSQIERMFSAGREEHFGAGEMIVRENQILDALYVLLSGEVAVFLPESENRPAQIDITTKTMNDCFGEYSLVDHQPASASIRALSNCIVFSISHVTFEDYLESDREAGSNVYKNLLVVLVERLRADNAELDLFNLV